MTRRHPRMCLLGFGWRPTILRGLNLSDRRQYVKMSQHSSDLFDCSCGVPATRFALGTVIICRLRVTSASGKSCLSHARPRCVTGSCWTPTSHRPSYWARPTSCVQWPQSTTSKWLLWRCQSLQHWSRSMSFSISDWHSTNTQLQWSSHVTITLEQLGMSVICWLSPSLKR